jgi:hypothetical protein
MRNSETVQGVEGRASMPPSSWAFLDPIEHVPAAAHHLAGFRDDFQVADYLQQYDFVYKLDLNWTHKSGCH